MGKKHKKQGTYWGAIALSYPPPPPIVIDDSSWKNAAESFTVALTLTLGGYESAIAPKFRVKNVWTRLIPIKSFFDIKATC